MGNADPLTSTPITVRFSLNLTPFGAEDYCDGRTGAGRTDFCGLIKHPAPSYFMNWKHYFYLTRWAFRNDPALGYLMAPAVLCALEYHRLLREFKRTLSECVMHALIVSLDDK